MPDFCLPKPGVKTLPTFDCTLPFDDDDDDDGDDCFLFDGFRKLGGKVEYFKSLKDGCCSTFDGEIVSQLCEQVRLSAVCSFGVVEAGLGSDSERNFPVLRLAALQNCSAKDAPFSAEPINFCDAISFSTLVSLNKDLPFGFSKKDAFLLHLPLLFDLSTFSASLGFKLSESLLS